MTTTTLPAGPAGLGLGFGADARITDDGWLERDLYAAPGLDGPPGVLQGGLAVGVCAAAARLADRHGAPLTAVDARLHAPTPLGRELTVRVRPADAIARYEVETRHGDRPLVTAEVELAGHDPAPSAYDLFELARVPLPAAVEQELFPTCVVCGAASRHPLAQHALPGWHRPGAVVVPWVADEALARVPAGGRPRGPGARQSSDAMTGVVDDLWVAAVLDCPTAWAVMDHVHERGDVAALLGSYHLRMFADAPVMEPLRIVALADEPERRRHSARGALLDEDGIVYAVSAATHISVPELPEL